MLKRHALRDGCAGTRCGYPCDRRWFRRESEPCVKVIRLRVVLYRELPQYHQNVSPPRLLTQHIQGRDTTSLAHAARAGDPDKHVVDPSRKHIICSLEVGSGPDNGVAVQRVDRLGTSTSLFSVRV